MDNPKHVPFFKAVISELKERGHIVTVTCTKSLNKISESNNINAKAIGSIVSFFGLFLEFSHFTRAMFLMDYVKIRNIDIAFSLGSKSVFYTCIQTNMPIILLLENIEKRPHRFYFVLEKGFFIIPEDVHDQTLIEKGYDLKKIAKYKGDIDLENSDIKSIKDIANQIEFLSGHIGNELRA